MTSDNSAYFINGTWWTMALMPSGAVVPVEILPKGFVFGDQINRNLAD